MKTRIFTACVVIAVGIFIINFSASTITFYNDGRIHTPGESVPEDSTWVAYAILSEYSSSTLASTYRSDRISYPNAAPLEYATNLYNCHAYAWTLASGDLDKGVWILSPDQETFWEDNSFTTTTSGDSDLGPISYNYYANSDHSAVKLHGTNYVVSKWGSGPLMKHTLGYDPYQSGLLSYSYYARSDGSGAPTPQSTQVGVNAYISGDGDLVEFETGYWTANYDKYFITPVTYQWWYKEHGVSTWSTGGTSSTFSRTVQNPGTFSLKLTVTDTLNQSDMDYYYVLVTEEGGPVKLSPTESITPKEFKLGQNYPNPFNPVTTIKYSIPENSEVSLKVYNIQGREVAHLVSQHQDAGYHYVLWDASNVASGTYFYKVTAGKYSAVKRMTVIK